MNSRPTCYICKFPSMAEPKLTAVGFACQRCGEYRINNPLSDTLPYKQSEDDIAKIAGWIHEQNEASVVPIIDDNVIERVTRRPRPGLRTRAFLLMKYLAKSTTLQSFFGLSGGDNIGMLGVSYSYSQKELYDLLSVLEHDGHVLQNSGAFRLLPSALLALEEAGIANSSASKGFVAMNFDMDMNAAWSNGFEPAIHKSGYQAVRISDKDYIGGITDEIIAEIRASRFIVADYTGQKAGVYFEAGFALGLGLPVIPTCRKDEVENLHFDIRHLNTLIWDDPADLSERLSKRISAVIGNGPNPT